jgi:UDP-glucuronate decarboxylase
MHHISQFESDVNEIVERSYEDLQELLSHNILVTGGGGFVGRWIVTALATFAERQKSKCTITSFSRTTPKWQEELLERELISVVNGDITAPLQIGTDFGHVFHCATPASAALNALDPAGMQKLIEAGARNLAAHFASTGTRVVNVSSGAVYGVQPTAIACFDEEWVDAREHTLPDSAYHRGKSRAEVFLNGAVRAGQLDVVHARLFAFLAPHLPLDAHFAAGNFLKNAIDNRPTTIAGDGRTIRTYMYGTDLAVWTFAIAARGKTGRAYNVGSPRPISIADLAALIATLSGSSHQPVDLGNPDLQRPPHRYVPCTNRIESELGVTLDVDLTDAISRTLNWLREL